MVHRLASSPIFSRRRPIRIPILDQVHHVLAARKDGVIVDCDKPNIFFLFATLNADDAGLIVDPSKQRAAAPAVIGEWRLEVEHGAIAVDVSVFR
jgi:hypothetical protein